MIERIEKIEEELKVIRYAYQQNKLFLESHNEAMDSSNLLLKTLPEFNANVVDRIQQLEELFESLKSAVTHQGELQDVMHRNIKHISEILNNL